MSNIKVSVIIPVYNVETYLKECLDSVINQTLKEIEIICIDDCSTDNSYQILEEYAKKDNRIRIFKNEKNIGPGPTRNIAFKKAVGEYIYCIDSDDYISLNYINELYNTAIKYNSDMTSNLNILKIENDQISYYLPYSKKIVSENILEGESQIDISDDKYGEKEYPYVTLWNHLLKREFIIKNDLFFLEINARWEDTDFYYRFMLNNPKTSYNHRSVYYHRINSNSIVQTSKDNLENNIKAINHLYNSINYCKQKNDDILLKYIYKLCWIDINTLFHQSGKNPLFYEHMYNFANKISLTRNVTSMKNFREYLIIKSNDSYDKYFLQKELFDKIQNIENYINNKMKFFAIYNSNNEINIIFFGIRLTIKKKK